MEVVGVVGADIGIVGKGERGEVKAGRPARHGGREGEERQEGHESDDSDQDETPRHDDGEREKAERGSGNVTVAVGARSSRVMCGVSRALSMQRMDM